MNTFLTTPKQFTTASAPLDAKGLFQRTAQKPATDVFVNKNKTPINNTNKFFFSEDHPEYLPDKFNSRPQHDNLLTANTRIKTKAKTTIESGIRSENSLKNANFRSMLQSIITNRVHLSYFLSDWLPTSGQTRNLIRSKVMKYESLDDRINQAVSLLEEHCLINDELFSCLTLFETQILLIKIFQEHNGSTRDLRKFIQSNYPFIVEKLPDDTASLNHLTKTIILLLYSQGFLNRTFLQNIAVYTGQTNNPKEIFDLQATMSLYLQSRSTNTLLKTSDLNLNYELHPEEVCHYLANRVLKFLFGRFRSAIDVYNFITSFFNEQTAQKILPHEAAYRHSVEDYLALIRNKLVDNGLIHNDSFYSELKKAFPTNTMLIEETKIAIDNSKKHTVSASKIMNYEIRRFFKNTNNLFYSSLIITFSEDGGISIEDSQKDQMSTALEKLEDKTGFLLQYNVETHLFEIIKPGNILITKIRDSRKIQANTKGIIYVSPDTAISIGDHINITLPPSAIGKNLPSEIKELLKNFQLSHEQSAFPRFVEEDYFYDSPESAFAKIREQYEIAKAYWEQIDPTKHHSKLKLLENSYQKVYSWFQKNGFIEN